MHNYSKNNVFWDYNLKLNKMIDMHSKYDNMYKNGIFYALICINNHIIACINCMLLVLKPCIVAHDLWSVNYVVPRLRSP